MMLLIPTTTMKKKRYPLNWALTEKKRIWVWITDENQKPLSSFQIAILSVSQSDFIKISIKCTKKTRFEAKLTTPNIQLFEVYSLKRPKFSLNINSSRKSHLMFPVKTENSQSFSLLAWIAMNQMNFKYELNIFICRLWHGDERFVKEGMLTLMTRIFQTIHNSTNLIIPSFSFQILKN